MPTSDPSRGLFKRRLEIDLPGGERERVARQLAYRGLLRIEERTFVRCVNPLDPDQNRLSKDRLCDGRIYLNPRFDESNHDYRCPHCNRIVFPSRKRKTQSIRLVPEDDAITALIEGQIRAAGFDPVERPRGLYRVATDGGQADVCVVDRYPQPDVFQAGYATPVLFVLLDDGLAGRLPRPADVFRLADIALGDAGQRFQRRLREVVRGNPDATGLPAALTLPVQMALPRPVPRPAPVADALAPSGARWLDVEFFFIDGDTVAYRVSGGRARRLTFKDVPGMADSRGSSRTKQWDLLVALCMGKGRLPWQGTPKERNAFKERVSQLRKHLQAAFGINGNPLKLSSATGLSTGFRAFPHAPSDRPIEDALEDEYPT